MDRPRSTPSERKKVTDLINNAMDSDGKCTLSKKDVHACLNQDDPDIEDRMISLIKPKLKKEGITFKSNSDNYNFTVKATAIKDCEETQTFTQKGVVNIEKGSIPKVNANPSKGKTDIKHKYVYPPQFADVKHSILAGDIPLLVGPPGCGKSILLENVAHNLGEHHFNRPYALANGELNPDRYKFIRMSLGGYIDPADIVGTVELVEDPEANGGKGGVTTKFVPGALTEAVEHGYMVIFDEWDTMSPETNSVFQRITETDGKMVIKTEKGAMVIDRHPHFRMAFTANTYGDGDETGMFGGAQPQNAALKDRINCIYSIDYNPPVERRILQDFYKLPPKLLDKLYGTDPDCTETDKALVNNLRANQKKNDDTIRGFLTMRIMMQIGEKYKFFGYHKTFNNYFLMKFPPSDHETIKATMASIFGKGLVPSDDRDFIDSNKNAVSKSGFDPLEDGYVPDELKGLMK